MQQARKTEQTTEAKPLIRILVAEMGLRRWPLESAIKLQSSKRVRRAMHLQMPTSSCVPVTDRRSFSLSISRMRLWHAYRRWLQDRLFRRVHRAPPTLFLALLTVLVKKLLVWALISSKRSLLLRLFREMLLSHLTKKSPTAEHLAKKKTLTLTSVVRAQF